MGSHWLPSEDLQMCISFVRHSLDEYDGNKQKDKLLETIFSDYMQNWKLAPGEKPPNVERTRIGLVSHYNKFKLFLQKWGESLATARQKIASGTSLMDEVSLHFFMIYYIFICLYIWLNCVIYMSNLFKYGALFTLFVLLYLIWLNSNFI